MKKACAFKQAFTLIFKIDFFKENYEIKFLSDLEPGQFRLKTLPNLKKKYKF